MVQRAAMTDDLEADRQELERALATARRAAEQPRDPLTKERLVRELEAQLADPDLRKQLSSRKHKSIA